MPSSISQRLGSVISPSYDVSSQPGDASPRLGHLGATKTVTRLALSVSHSLGNLRRNSLRSRTSRALMRYETRQGPIQSKTTAAYAKIRDRPWPKIR
jgi:hypothetical protein